MSYIGPLHLAAAITALVSGAWILLQRKATRAHRRIGWIYVAGMLTLNVTALLIYRLTGRFGIFHVFALVSLLTLAAGIIPMRRAPRRGTWLESHYFFMTYSYAGLAAAAVAETATRVRVLQTFAGGPTPAFWITVAAATFAVMGVSSWLIRTRADRTIQPLRR